MDFFNKNFEIINKSSKPDSNPYNCDPNAINRGIVVSCVYNYYIYTFDYTNLKHTSIEIPRNYWIENNSDKSLKIVFEEIDLKQTSKTWKTYNIITTSIIMQ